MSAIDQQVEAGAVRSLISNVCPPGTKFHVLEVGWLECDEAFVLRGANISLKSSEDKPFVNKRRELPAYCILIEHPHEGLILYETGCGKDYPKVWGPMMSDVFARVRYEPQHELEAAIEATGNKVSDVKKIILGHLHLDHAGGLDIFLDRKDVEIWVHDKELKAALWNWKTFDDRTIDFCQGVVLHHVPGHTDGLLAMQLNMPNSGTFLFIGDHCHVMENWRDGIPQGYLARDHPSWFQSQQRLKRLERLTKAKVIPGHDKDVFLALKAGGPTYT